MRPNRVLFFLICSFIFANIFIIFLFNHFWSPGGGSLGPAIGPRVSAGPPLVGRSGSRDAAAPRHWPA